LKGTAEDTAVGIMEHLRKDQKLKNFCALLDNLELYPVLRDSKGYFYFDVINLVLFSQCLQ
jgi:hypothetical protein